MISTYVGLTRLGISIEIEIGGSSSEEDPDPKEVLVSSSSPHHDAFIGQGY